MTKTDFIKQFALVSLLALSSIMILEYLLAGVQQFGILSLFFFMILTVLMYIGGHFAASSSNKNLFTSIVMGFTLLKIILSLIVVISYHQWTTPSSKTYLIPFFVIYLIFTIFETHMMMVLSKTPQKT